ncbi:redoxin family protein [Micromonospora aurantiaca (nom. illeg.)]|uniref:Redoxin n=1 Tax=Micromonospora aurantiaca (nom. illeg.) TaxID=47850 RepID=A0A1C6TLL6_9ACTN|nr:redoxin family protein [Micromonospora aurantiaca]AXH94285.1 redoxin [Micromonospora aurantiaca]AXH94287.1 redoxin [Micromonospora aurantiaca]KAB1102918.1 redoxin domain-containing protein [Micromonospora aurantiaca]MBC9005328.1 redoxin family protein [Micromonospora aurantiaca]UFN93264.1 redoxin family protein [Micromonospora aurantiaca]
MRTAARVTAAAVLAATLAAATACAAGPEPGDRAGAVAPAPPAAASPSGPASAPASASPAVVPAALSFTGKTLDGTAFDAAALAGRPVVLWFWAPWCATCASQAWTVAEIAPTYRDTVPIVGVAGLGEQKAMKSFVTEFDLGGTTQIDDRAGALWRRFKVAEQSTFVVLDRTGRVVHQGFLDGEALTRQVETLARG